MVRNRRRMGRYAAPQQRLWLEIAGQRRLRRLHSRLAARREVLHRWSALLDDLDRDVSQRLSDMGGDEDGYDTASEDVNEPERRPQEHLQGARRVANRGRRRQLSRAWGLVGDDQRELDEDLDADTEGDTQADTQADTEGGTDGGTDGDEEREPMSKPAVETYYENGTWRSRHEGVSRPFATGGTKAEQVSKGREMARRDKVEHIIKNRDGTISERNSYGNDPHPPRG
jgi:hypothetical protein